MSIDAGQFGKIPDPWGENPQPIVPVLPFGRTAMISAIRKITEPDLFTAGFELTKKIDSYGSMGALLSLGYPFAINKAMLASFSLPVDTSIEQILAAHSKDDRGVRMLAAFLFGLASIGYVAQNQATRNGGLAAPIEMELVGAFTTDCAEQMQEDESFADFLRRKMHEVTHDTALYADDFAQLRLLRSDRQMMKRRGLRGLSEGDIERLRDNMALWLDELRENGEEGVLFQRLVITMHQHMDDVIDQAETLNYPDEEVLRSDTHDLINLGFYYGYWTLLRFQNNKEE